MTYITSYEHPLHSISFIKGIKHSFGFSTLYFLRLPCLATSLFTMLFAPSIISGLALLVSSALAAPQSPSLPRATCENSASNRSCWGEYDLSTNYYNVVPETNVTREYWLELVNTTAALDGIERNVLLVNGTFPGPTLFADWGDTVGKWQNLQLLAWFCYANVYNSCSSYQWPYKQWLRIAFPRY